VNLRIEVEGARSLDAYALVPIRFLVTSRLRVRWRDGGLGGIDLAEEPVEPPYWYDYDQFEPPSEWPAAGMWTYLAAYDDQRRIGGAAVAHRPAWLTSPDAHPGTDWLWDIRVAPEYRGRGVGRALFDAAVRVAAESGAHALAIETQDINVAACRFYARQGCRLEAIHPGVYAHDREQVQLIWYRRLDETG
jgi:ribosomal protein S18 acetylase RimI-like enzyme